MGKRKQINGRKTVELGLQRTGRTVSVPRVKHGLISVVIRKLTACFTLRERNASGILSSGV